MACVGSQPTMSSLAQATSQALHLSRRRAIRSSLDIVLLSLRVEPRRRW